MTRILLDIKRELDLQEITRYQEIMVALISCGGLSGVKNGRTILHFDRDGEFMGVELNYWPWRKRDLTKI